MTKNILDKGKPLSALASSPPTGALISKVDENYCEISQISTTAATPIDTFLENSKKCIARAKYSRLQNFPSWGKPKLTPIAIVGGGPSLNKPEILVELKQFYARYEVIAAGSSHDWMVEHGMRPNYAVVCDPDPVSANYIRRHSGYTKYFIASSCDSSVFDALDDEDVYIWHNHSDETEYIDKLAVIDPNYTFTVGGGCTVGLRSIVIAIFMGYRDIHLFGFDSCLGDDDVRYAYPLSTERECMGRVFPIRFGCGGPTSKLYRCEGYHLAQASHFKNLYRDHHDKFTPTFHGDSMIKDLVDHLHEESQKLAESGAINE